ncbi:hypothetical protein Glove_467g10 [Diversispora epigaea]|uniref:Protein phosphatase 1 regulatory subunit 21 N-terminal domain-containing protein n=1 Tax=Diversispora epigaea TaxID=1348612 RepID=A0A397GLP1_9GLOM|nr:hypothetical protein Glove_467g10 [Diversispora epigaea]
MSDGRHSTSVSLQSSVGTTSAEELAEKYQKLFQEFSRIKAQHSVLKKAVIKEQATNAALQDECKTKERELRSSIQQLDLLTFHNQRLTKRIECLQDSGTARLNPSWLVGVGSSKKALEKSKVTLEVTSIELTRKIEENEKLHKELYEVNGVYAQHETDLKAKILDLEKKTGELQEELTRSHLASEEALNTIRQEKNELDNELVETREELRSTQNLIEQHEQKLKEGDDVLRNEIIALRETLSINLGLDENQNDQFSALKDKIDPESNELIESFRHLQSSAREYLNSLKEKSGSYELGLKVKNASQVWHRNLQKLAINLSNAQNRISELIAEKENLIKANENDSTKVESLEKEIIRLKEELENQKATADNLIGKGGSSSDDGLILNNEITTTTSRSTSRSTTGERFDIITKDDEEQNNSHQEQISSTSTTTTTTTQDNDRANVEELKRGSPISFEDFQESDDDDDNESGIFVYPVGAVKGTSFESSGQSTKELSLLPTVGTQTSVYRNGISLDPNIARSAKSEDAANREQLIKKHYESKIAQLQEMIQLSDSKSLRLYQSLKLMKEKLAESENAKLRTEQENLKFQHELSLLKEKIIEERDDKNTQINAMTEWIEQQNNKIKELETERTEYEAGGASQPHYG